MCVIGVRLRASEFISGYVSPKSLIPVQTLPCESQAVVIKRGPSLCLSYHDLGYCPPPHPHALRVFKRAAIKGHIDICLRYELFNYSQWW